MSPLAERALSSPSTVPISVWPLEFLATSEPSTVPTRRWPLPVLTSALPVTAPTLTWPTPVSTFNGPVRSRWTFPADMSTSVTPSTPLVRTLPAVTSASTLDPVGSSITTSTDLVFLEKSNVRFGPRIISVPSE